MLRLAHPRGSFRKSSGKSRLLEALESRLLLSAIYPDLRNVVAPADNPALPAGMDVYTPPVDAQTPGTSAPGLAELTRSGNADDALALTGYQLSSYTGADLGKDTQFTFWSQTTSGNGALAEGSILHVEALQAAVTIPASALNNSMYLVWAQNSTGPSYPLAINKTEAWWTGNSTATRGQTVSVYGRNLSYYNSTYTGTNVSWIYIRPTGGGAGQWITPTAVNPYKVDFVVPATLANGTYEVWVHNGHGGQYGWSRADNLTVQDAIAWNGVVRNVKFYGAVGDGVTDDTAAVNAAIAESQAGDKIYFPAGTYAFGTTAQIVFKASMQVYGDGMNSTTLNTSIKLQGYSKLNDLKVDSGTSATTSTVTGNFNWLTNTWFSMENGSFGVKTLDTSTAGFVYYTGCKFTGQSVWIGAKYDHYFDDCDFYARYDTEMCISSWGSNRVSITNCTFQHYDRSDPTNDSGWGEGRIFTDTCDWNAAGRVYYGGNTTTDFVVRPGGDQNSGEGIMNESGVTYYTGGIASATATTVTFASSVSTGSTIAIVSGKGLGQIRHVVAYDANTNTLTVDQPWNVTPDSASIVQLMKQPEKFAVYNNYFDGTPTAADQSAHVANVAVDLFTGGSEWLVDKNTFHEMRTGVNWTNYGSEGTMGINYSNFVANNTFDYVRWAGTEGGSSQPYVNVLMNVWRGNTVNNVRPGGAAFRETGGSGTQPSPMLSIFDHNTVTNSACGYQVSQTGDTHNTIFYNNSFDRGTATLAGSKGIDFGAATLDLAGKGVVGNGWSGVWASVSSSGNEHAKYLNGRQLSLGTAGYSNAGNQSDSNDGAAGQTIYNDREDRFTDRFLTTPMTGTVWVSALINRAEAQLTGLGFNPTGNNGGNSHRTWIGLAGANLAELKYNATAYTSSVTATLGTTYLLLAKIEVNYSGTFDRVSYWFNPTNLTGGEAGLGAPKIMKEGADAVGNSVLGVGVTFLRSATAPDTNLIDSIRLSNDPAGLAAVLSGTGNLVADYFNDTWGPLTWEPVSRGNTVTNFETQYADNLPKPGGVIEAPDHTLVATGTVGGGSVTVPLTVWNAGIESLTCNIADDASWLTLSAPSVTIAPQTGVGNLTLTCNPAGLAAGVYTATITLTASALPTRTVSVVFTVNPALMPSVTLQATDPNASETGPDTGTFTVTRTGTSGDLTVYYRASGTATSGTDYTALTGSVVILNGQSTATIVVTPLDDSLVEVPETIVATLLDGFGYTVASPASNTVTLADNDAVATPAVSVVATNPWASERGATGTFTITRNGTTGNLTVNYTLTGTAINGTDYTSLPASVVIPDGAVSATVTVAPLADNLIEGNETVILTLTSGSGYTVGAPFSGTVNIAENSGSVGNVLSSFGAAGNGWAGAWTIGSSSGNEHAKLLYYKQLTYNTPGYSNVGNEGDTNDGAAGQTVYNDREDRYSERLLATPLTGTIWVSALVNLAESSTIALGFNPNGGAGANMHKTSIGLSAVNKAKLNYNSTPYTATVVAPLNTTHLMLAKIEMNYDGTNDRVSYWLDPNLAGGEAGLGYATVMKEGADTIGATFTGIGITSLRGANVPDSNLLDSIRISNDPAGFSAVTTGTGTFVAEYFNNYVTTTPTTITASATTPTATEAGPANGIFTVSRNGTSGALTVYYQVGGTAVSGSDYTPLIGSVSIANGASSATVLVTPNNDNWIETDETVTLTVLPGGNYLIGSQNSGTVTILSDDRPTITLAATTPNAAEQGQVPGVFTVTRSGLGLLTTGDLLVHYTLAGTATNTADYATLSGSVVIPDGQTSATITVTPVDDNLAEGTETVLLTLTGNSTYTLGTPNSATVSIADKFSTGGTWTDLDLGGPGATGSIAFTTSTQTFTVSGAGADIGGTTDSFHYFYQPLVGDGTLIARVPSVANTNSAAKAGIMIRNTLDATSAQAMVAVTPSNAVSFLTRTTAGGSTTSTSASGLGAAPYWVKLVRSGNVFTAYASSDPATVGWTQVGVPTTLAMNQTVYVGLAVTSHVAGTLCAATFDRVALTVSQLPVSGVTLNVGTLQLAPGTSPNTLTQIASLTITGGTLDLTNNDLLVANGAAQEQTISTHLLPVPAADGTTTPITTTGVLTGTAYSALYGNSFHGQPLTPNALVLQYTRAGDSDLSGQISMDDYLAADAGYLFGRSANGTWATGDFNHDGKVNAADYALLDQNFRAAGAPMAGAMIELHTTWFGPSYLAPAPVVAPVAPVPPTVPAAPLPTPTVPTHPLPPTPLSTPVWWTFPSPLPTLQARITLANDLTLDLLGNATAPRTRLLLPARSRLATSLVRVAGPVVS